MRLTRELAYAAARDAANAHARKHGRAAWNAADYGVCAETFDRLWPVERDLEGR